LMKALPNYPCLTEHIVLPTGTSTHYRRETVEQVTGPLPAGVDDWSINCIFPKRRPYVGSSFLDHPLADIERPAAPYVVVVPLSTWGVIPAGRDFDAADWQAVLDYLDREGLSG